LTRTFIARTFKNSFGSDTWPGHERRTKRPEDKLAGFFCGSENRGSELWPPGLVWLWSGFWPGSESDSDATDATDAASGQAGNILVWLLCWLCADKRIVLSTGMIYAPAHSNWANRRTNGGLAVRLRIFLRPFPSPLPLNFPISLAIHGPTSTSISICRMCFSRTSACVSHGMLMIVLPPRKLLLIYVCGVGGILFSFFGCCFIFSASFFSKRVCRVEKLV